MKSAIIFSIGLAIALVVGVKSVTDDVETIQKLKVREELNRYLLWGHALANTKHNLILGAKQPGDWLLNQKVINVSSSWIPFMRESAKYNYTIPNRGGYITYVEVLDQSTNGKGGYASLVSGGPGYRNVTINFESQRSQGLKFIVSVYGPHY